MGQCHYYIPSVNGTRFAYISFLSFIGMDGNCVLRKHVEELYERVKNEIIDDHSYILRKSELTKHY